MLIFTLRNLCHPPTVAAKNLPNLKTEIAGDRNITLLLAKLYGKQLIAPKKCTTDGNLPANIF
jgi:hypothetical protein